MIWVKRILFTFIYLLLVYFIMTFTNISLLVVLLFSIIFSSFISRNSIFSGLEKYLHS
ncbi:Uncharacterised protein [Enterococcus casseliflavus]|uniref:Uncharacterized protein n=1 Tax=Enterococcus casseliflavus TaxID=37734 RepID=A0A6N3G895_ENTCA